MDSERFRVRVVHGWTFCSHSPEEVEAIREYLRTGNREVLPETYRKIAETLSA